MRGFIDDGSARSALAERETSLNPRSCAASSMTRRVLRMGDASSVSQSAFMRGFIDDTYRRLFARSPRSRLNPRSCAASSMTSYGFAVVLLDANVSIRVHARLHR